MKRALLYLSLITLPFIGNTQTAINQADIQSLGNTIMYHLVDSNAVTYENTTGSGVTWDYATITGYNLTKDGLVGDPDTSDYSTYYTNSDNYLFLEDYTGLFYSLTSTEMTTEGYVFEDVDVPLVGASDIALVLNSNPIISLNFPFDINTPQIVDNFSGTIESGALTSTPASGISYAEIDGEGTLELPGQSFSNVVRVVTTDTANASINLFPSALNVEIRRKQYDYRNSSSKFPLFSLSDIQIVNTDTGDDLANFKAVLSSVAPFTSAEDFNDVTSVHYYPNPTQGNVTFLLRSQVNNSGSYQVINSLGQVVSENDINVVPGANQFNIDLSSAPNGMYFVKITSGNFVSTKKINKR